MRKKILFGVAVLAIATVVTFNVSFGAKSNELSADGLANVEALLAISHNVYPQNDSIISVRGGSMSDLPFSVTNKENIAHFGFSGMSNNMNIEISLWETTQNSDSLCKRVLIAEDLLKKEHPRMDIVVEQNEKQADIKNILAGKYVIISPIKPQKYRIQSFPFRSKPKIEGKCVPIVIFVDNDKENLDVELKEILTFQDITLLRPQTIRNLKKKIGEFKILTYYLKILP